MLRDPRRFIIFGRINFGFGFERLLELLVLDFVSLGKLVELDDFLEPNGRGGVVVESSSPLNSSVPGITKHIQKY